MTQREELNEDTNKLNCLLNLDKETLANVSLQQSKIIEKLQKSAKSQAIPESVTPKESMTPVKDDDFVLVPRGILGAACSAIYKKRDAPILLSKLRELSMSVGAMRAAPVKDGEQ